MGYTSSEIAFPGLGIDKFVIDRTAFTLFGRDIAWYGVIIAIGMIVAVAYVMYRAKQYRGITSDDIIDYAICIIFFGVIGARIYYVINSDTHYTFLEAFEIWNGGLAIYGGVIAGGLAALVVSYVKGIRPLCILDMVAPGVMIAQAIGRWGNFCNGECFGGQTTLPWRMELTHLNSRGNVVEAFGTVHPAFLYESLWNIIGFVLINIFYKKRKFDGQVFFMYVAWYGFGRGFIELLRTDSLYAGAFRVSLLVGFVSCAAAIAFMIVGWKKGKIYDTVATPERVAKLAKKTEKNNELETDTDINTEKGENENGNDN